MGLPLPIAPRPVRLGEPCRGPADPLMPALDPIPPEQLARLWALLTDPDPDAIARLLRRPRLAHHPRRLRVACRSPLLIFRTSTEAVRGGELLTAQPRT